MYLVLLIITVIVCLLLGFIVLIQNPKGGGLSSNFSSSSQLMGVQKTGDFLEKGTWTLAIGLMVLSLAINVVVKGGANKDNSDAKARHEATQQASKPSNTAAPAASPFGAAPAQQQTAPATPKK